ncbi:adhesion G protein-coupled receptor E3-like isoform X2 [Lytechinus variegatus]|uniref:adhesion G protein-coupled receptor E3-like isoform X2 n=1 Tax=Lytechinus variegatus TaxID=7654 RepID=UPI001BB24E11|nr:adhesion G protein-coupled receptor E3-like isoform X2 [Lytechinus variegatus]
MAENFLCLFRFFAFCRVLSLILPSIYGYPLCTQAILEDFSADECPQIFPECTSGSLGSIEINSASVTVTSDDGYGGKDISTVDATEATNSIVNCGDVPTCEGVGYFLIAHFSTLHCLGIQPGMDSFVPAGLRYILAVVTVRYTGMQGVSTFQERYDGHFYHSVYRFGSGNNECSSFRVMSEHQLPFATNTSILSSIPCAYIYTTTNGVDTTDDLTESTSHSPVSTLAPSQSIHAIPTSDQGGITVSPWSDRDLIPSVTSDTTTGDLTTSPSSVSPSILQSSPSVPMSNRTSIPKGLELLFYPEILEQRIFGIATNLSNGQSIEIDNIYVYRSILQDLCSTGWRKTDEDGNQYFWPSNYFCDIFEGQNETAERPVPVILGIASSSHLAELYNNIISKDATINASTDTILRVASNIITAAVFIGNVSVSLPFSFNLTQSIMLTHEFSSPSCRFFHEQTRSWNTTGCTREIGNDGTMTSCYCDHMTSFAILVRLLPNDPEVDMISNIITWSGLGLSVTSLSISLITLFVLRRSLTADRVIIHVNLMIAILFFDIAFFSVTYKPIEIKSMCKAFAFVLHYFSLAVMFWMLVEGVHLYRQIIKVFDSGNPRTWLYGILGWGCPAIIISITGGLKHESYGYGRSCWLNPSDGTMWAFGGPAFAIVLVNVVILAMVVKTVVSASRGQLDNDNVKQIRNGLRSTLLLCPLLGMAWLLSPALVFFPRIKALEYTFNVLNSLQGFFISLFYCFLNAEVRNAIREHVRKSQDSRNFDSESATVSASEQNPAKTGRRRIRVRPAPVSQTQALPAVSTN